MPASPPIGNKNAEKYDLDKSIELFEKAIEMSNETEVFKIKIGDGIREVNGYKWDFIGEIARELGTYHEIFKHLKNRFPDELSGLNKTLHNNMEQNCYSNTKKGLIKEATGIVNLKANYKWSDRVDTTSGDKPLKREKTVIKFVDKSDK